MEHNHNHAHLGGHHHHEHHKNIGIAFALNFAFTIIELIGGVLTNSVAILSDALHDLGDTFSLGLSYYLEKVAGRDADPSFSYGYRRFSLLSALANCLVLIGGSIFILLEAVPRLLEPQQTVPEGMIALALLGIAVNGAAVFKLRHGDTLNAKAVMWHLVEDVAGWVVVLVVSIIMLLGGPAFHILDPVFSVCFTLFILWNVFKMLKATLLVFLQATPSDIDVDAITTSIRFLADVCDIHHLHVWSLDGAYHVISLHVVVDADLPRERVVEIKQQANDIAAQHGIQHTTVEIEFGYDDCTMRGSCC